MNFVILYFSSPGKRVIFFISITLTSRDFWLSTIYISIIIIIIHTLHCALVHVWRALQQPKRHCTYVLYEIDQTCKRLKASLSTSCSTNSFFGYI